MSRSPTPPRELSLLAVAIDAYRDALAARHWPEDLDPSAPEVAAVTRELIAIADSAVAHEAYKDTWLFDPESVNLRYGRMIRLIPEKLGASYFLGFHLRSGIFLAAELLYAEHLEAMSDTYWERVCALQRFGMVSFGPLIQLTALAGQEARRSRTGNSAVFRMIRDGALGGCGHRRESLPGPATLDVWWSPSTGSDQLRAEIGAALRMLYDVNYDLYRVEYQRRRHRKPR